MYIGGVEKNTNDPVHDNGNLSVQSYYFWESMDIQNDVSIESLWVEEMPIVDGNLLYTNVENASLNVLIHNSGTTSIDGLSSPFVYDVASWELCVWTSMPNGSMDNNRDNQLACINLDLTVSTHEIKSSAFSIFPNPATDDCTITWGENLRPETVRIFDLVGRLLRSEAVDPSAGQHALQLSGLVSGVYVVELGGVAVRVIRSSSSGQ